MATTSGSGSKDARPDWQRLRYPDEATFDRLLKEHEGAVWNEEAADYRPYHGIPAWIRLGWPSKDLWDRAARTVEIEEATAARAAGVKIRIPAPWPVASIPWAEVLKTYPLREGVPDHEQDHLKVLHYWPSVYGEPMVDFAIHRVITINETHYNIGRHRAPSSVAAALRDTDQRAVAEVMKAVMPKNHPDREMVISALSGASS